MKGLITIALCAVLSGCAGTAFDGRICALATDADAEAYVKEIMDMYASEEDKAKASLYIKTAKLGAVALCEAARFKQGLPK